MKHRSIPAAALILAGIALRGLPAFAAAEKPAETYLRGLTWLGHASFRWARGGAVVYLDPFQISSEPHDADLVLISHPHFDHLDPAAVARVSKPGTVVVTVQECAEKLKGSPLEIRVVKPGDRREIRGVRLEAVAAYNLDKPHHPRENQWVGFVVEMDGVRLYHAGDTDFIPEMKQIQADVALLPVGGTYTMTAEEAASAAQALRPKVAVPMHYGSIIGTRADAEKFRSLCGGLIVEILENENAEWTVSAKVNKTRAAVGENLLFSITINGPLPKTPKVQMAPLKGFQVVSTSQSQQIQIQAGKTRQALMLTYVLVPTEPGSLQIGRVTVDVEGKVYETEPIEVNVGSPSPELEGGVVL